MFTGLEGCRSDGCSFFPIVDPVRTPRFVSSPLRFRIAECRFFLSCTFVRHRLVFVDLSASILITSSSSFFNSVESFNKWSFTMSIFQATMSGESSGSSSCIKGDVGGVVNMQSSYHKKKKRKKDQSIAPNQLGSHIRCQSS